MIAWPSGACSQGSTTWPHPEADQCSLRNPNPLLQGQLKNCHPIYVLVFQIVLFFQVSPPKSCMRFSSPSFLLYVKLVLCFLSWSSEWYLMRSRLRFKCNGTCAETRFRLSTKRTGPFKSVWASVQSTTGSRGVRISGSNAGYTMFRGSVRVLATHSIRHFPLHFPSRASPCAITFQLDSTDHKFSSYAFSCGPLVPRPS